MNAYDVIQRNVMRFLACTPFISVSMLMAADATTQMPGMSHLLQGGALGVLAWTIWYMLAKAFPAHNKALRDQREAFLAVLKEDKEALREERRRFVSSAVNDK